MRHILALAALTASFAWAQGTLTVQDIKVSNGGDVPEAQFTVKNGTGKGVVAYTFRVTFGDQPQASAAHMIVSSHGTAKGPGQSWPGRMTIPGRRADAPLPQFALDFILFTDGSTTGPDTLKTSVRISGILSGVNGERARLRRLLETGGLAALEADLKKP